MTTIRLSGSVLALATASIRLSGAELAASLGGGDVSIRLSGASIEGVNTSIGDNGMWLCTDNGWKPVIWWVDCPE